MKKIFCALLCIITCGTGLAITTVDLSQHTYTCKNVHLTDKITETFILENCKQAKLKLYTYVNNGIQISNVKTNNGADIKASTTQLHSRIEFYTDQNDFMKCYFEVNKFEKCEVSEPKTTVKLESGAQTK